MTQKIYSTTLPMDTYDVADLLHLFLKVSGEHDQVIDMAWDPADEKILSTDGRWVITQYHMEIDQWPKSGEEAQIETRIIAANRFFVTRYFELKQGENVSVRLYSQYAGINFVNRSMENLHIDGLRSKGLIDSKVKAVLPRLPKFGQGESQHRSTYEAQEADIDINEHVNNTRYPLWCLAQIDETYKAKHTLKQIDIRYKQEVLEGEELFILSEWLDPKTSLHSIQRAKDGKELTQIQFQWKER